MDELQSVEQHRVLFSFDFKNKFHHKMSLELILSFLQRLMRMIFQIT